MLAEWDLTKNVKVTLEQNLNKKKNNTVYEVILNKLQ